MAALLDQLAWNLGLVNDSTPVWRSLKFVLVARMPFSVKRALPKEGSASNSSYPHTGSNLNGSSVSESGDIPLYVRLPKAEKPRSTIPGFQIQDFQISQAADPPSQPQRSS